MSLLFLLKSISLMLLLCPPPLPYVVTLPFDLPEVFKRDEVRDFSGLVLVISSKVKPLLKRWDGDIGLVTFIGILSFFSFHLYFLNIFFSRSFYLFRFRFGLSR